MRGTQGGKGSQCWGMSTTELPQVSAADLEGLLLHWPLVMVQSWGRCWHIAFHHLCAVTSSNVMQVCGLDSTGGKPCHSGDQSYKV